jgi:hypothetical protein
MTKKGKESQEIVRSELENDRRLMSDTIKLILDDLMVYLATKNGVRNIDGSCCKNLKQLYAVFRDNCESIADAKIFWDIFYGFTKLYPNWQLETAAAAMIIQRWKYDDKEFEKGKYRLTFAEKLVTTVITAIRKSLNDAGKNGIPGYSLTNMMEKGSKNEKDNTEMQSGLFKVEYIKVLNVSTILSNDLLSYVI